MEVVEVSIDYGGRTLTLQTGRLAKQADASVVCKYGDTVVLASVVSSHSVKEGQDFFPLTVDYQEKYYAAGRIPGGFFKREARPSEKATLSARLVDRPIRPLFPEDYLCDTNVTITVLSIDGVNEPDIAASIATSAALHISDIPWSGPIGTCRVGMIDGKPICNITPEDQPNSQLELLVSGVKTGVIMVEGGSKEVSEAQMMDAIDFAHSEMQKVIGLIEEFRTKTGSKEKRDYDKPAKDEALKKQMRTFLWGPFENAFSIREKLLRYEALSELKKTVKDKFGVAEVETAEDKTKNKLIDSYYEELKATYARELTVNSKRRIDGRGYSDIRNISCDVGILPRVHGTGLFTRGETQVLSSVTLGTADDEQTIDNIAGTYEKSFMLHYNFPPFSVGEARPLRPPGRREIGHGHLAERALAYVIPPKEVFPYTVRIVAEVLESNGSSSMASVCSGSLALMDAGVPVPKPVAGVAMGLIKEGEKIAVLTDILGDEDHLGDMDFKVCGTAEGVTAFQMDLKIGGVSREIMEKALSQARDGRLHILEKMNATLDKARAEMSQYAPRIHTIKIKPDKVREVIGSGGKVIRGIIEQTGVKIDIEDDGQIHIASSDEASARKAIEIINQITEEPEIGKVYEGRVSRIAEFGAFVEIIPGTDGLVHISELEHFRVRRVEDVVKEGDIIQVKCLDVDQQGKIRLSRKALLPKEGAPEATGNGSREAGAAGDAQPAADASDDEAGNRREPRGLRSDRGDRGDRSDRGDRGDRGERSDRGDRGDRGGRGGRDRGDRSDRGERSDRGDRGDRGSSFRDRDRGGERDRGPRDRDRGPRGGNDRDDRDRGNERGDRGDRFGGMRDPRAAIMDRNEVRFDRGPDRGDRDREDRYDRDGNRMDRDERNRQTNMEREDREQRDHERGVRRLSPDRGGDDRGNRRDRGGFGGGDRGPRGGGDRGPRGGGDRGPRGGGDRGPRGGGDRDDRPSFRRPENDDDQD